MEFKQLTIHGLIDSSALTSALSEADLQKKSSASTATEFERGATSGLPNIGSEWTFRDAKCNT